MAIGGNKEALIQVRTKGVKNKIGAYETPWIDCMNIQGWLDMSSADSKHTTFNAKIEESTHFFLCDYHDLKNVSVGEDVVEIKSENSRFVIDGQIYEIKWIDDPMDMHEHLEIYLRFIGGQ